MTTSHNNTKTTERPDRELLASYVGEADQQAFALLVRRYAGLVMGVCRRSSRDSHHAEDAFQATFMVFAKNARKVRDPDALSSWLHGVAYRTSLRLNRKTTRQLSGNLNEEQMVVSDDPFEKLTSKFANQKTDEELHRLPEQLRTPMILRYLSGKNNAEIADHLGLSVSAVEGRLKRAKSKLRARLMRHGISVGTVVAALAVTRESEAAIPESLIESTIENSLSFHSSSGTALEPATEQVAKLASEEAIAMSILSSSKLTVFACSAAIVMTGIGLTPVITAANGAGGNGSATHTTTNSAADSTVETVIQVAAADDPFGAESSNNSGASSADSNPFDFDDHHAPSDSNPFVASSNTTKRATKSTKPAPATEEIRFFDVKKRSAAELTIARTLNASTTINLYDQSVAGLVSEFADLHKDVQFLIDQKALASAGIDPGTTTVTDAELSNLPLRDALDLVLDELDLTWLPKNNVLLITSNERAENTLENRIYPVQSDLLTPAANLIETITSHTAPDSWSEVGGPGSISQVGDSLVIRQTYRVHEEISDLLSQLETSMKRPDANSKAAASSARR